MGRNKINDLEKNREKEISRIKSKIQNTKVKNSGSDNKEDVKRVQISYEKKIKEYQSQIQGLQAAKRNHEREQKKAKSVLENMRKLKLDIVDLKKTKSQKTKREHGKRK